MIEPTLGPVVTTNAFLDAVREARTDTARLETHDTLVRLIEVIDPNPETAVRIVHTILRNLVYVRYGLTLPCDQPAPGLITDPRR